MDIHDIKRVKHTILNQITDEDFFRWKGNANGDSICKFQGRRLKQMALVMLLVGEELENEKVFMDEGERKYLFNKFIRHLNDQPIDDSGSAKLNLSIIGNIWKSLT